VIVCVADVNITSAIDNEGVDVSESGRLGCAVTGGALLLSTSNRVNEAVAPYLPNSVKLGDVYVPKGVGSDAIWTIEGRAHC
jgi:hypothetical protein